MQIINRQITLAAKLFFLYTAVFIIGIGIAAMRADTAVFSTTTFWLKTLAVIVSIIFISLLAAKLPLHRTLNKELSIYLALSLLIAATVNTQTVFAIAIIFSTTFIYECQPFYLRRWKFFSAIIFTINSAAVFFSALFMLCGFIGLFPLAVFISIYSIIISGKSFYRLMQKESKKIWQIIIDCIKVHIWFSLFFISTSIYVFGWIAASLK